VTSYGPTLLKIDHVSLSYNGRPILRDVCAEVRELVRTDGKGQVVGFLGPSGVGKTQLFRIIAGLNQPTSGQILLKNGEATHPGLVGVVAQNYPLFEHRTVLSNLMLAAGRVGAPLEEVTTILRILVCMKYATTTHHNCPVVSASA